MEVWIRRYIGIISISGSALGISAIAGYFSLDLELSQWLVLFAVCIFFIWSAYIGLRIIEGTRETSMLLQALTVQFLQVPIISFPAFTYQLASGFHLDFIYSTYEGLKLSIKLGSVSKFGFLEGGELVVVGINIVALVTMTLITKCLFPSPKTKAVELTRT